MLFSFTFVHKVQFLTRSSIVILQNLVLQNFVFIWKNAISECHSQWMQHVYFTMSILNYIVNLNFGILEKRFGFYCLPGSWSGDVVSYHLRQLLSSPNLEPFSILFQFLHPIHLVVALYLMYVFYVQRNFNGIEVWHSSFIICFVLENMISFFGYSLCCGCAHGSMFCSWIPSKDRIECVPWQMEHVKYIFILFVHIMWQQKNFILAI